MARHALPVFVPGWLLDDRSLAPPAVGDVIEVSLALAADADPPPWTRPVRATVRPAYGRSPVDGGDGLRWLLEVSGDGWAARWWSERPMPRRVDLDAAFVLDLPEGQDDPPPTRGTVRRIQVVRKRFERTDTGVRAVGGSERLTEVESTPHQFWSTLESDADGFVPTGVLVDLDLDDVPPLGTPFVPGSVSVSGIDVWVMDRSNPILLHVDTAADPHRVVEYLLPVPIEVSERWGWARAVHADPDGCWIVSADDVFRCDRTGTAAVTVERVSTVGGRSVLDDGSLYLLGRTTPMLCGDRRHGTVRIDADPHPVRVLGRDRRLRPVDVPETVTRVTAISGRRNEARGDDGTRWIAGRALVARAPDGTERSVDVTAPDRGSVHWRRPDPLDDPANVGLVPIMSLPLPTENRPDRM
ncbi:DUF6578 domain-containing protein [Rhodococcus sp. NPDC058505]|uniref:DUF6578 domain-containing protein n=1 Tax=Rhodococcus sp. NPDC058505 TaxID=3346531 RepID=UPI00365E4117